MAPRRATDTVDMLIGFAGFFGIVFLVVTIACELTGRPALGWALTLLGFVVLVGVLVRQRVGIVRRGAGADRVPTSADAHDR
jgi:lipid-A-disaccharide synthase-like uncharacterized protein